ncbi:DUF2147 domain-containing protein [Aquimarina intermedia]|uniref:Uncharacterized protein DUF2147 n=1 Tax=Aquimarina intermedia TaxID=350814 RepID=A0A5S5BWM0_9FLAO|nr:DUF2147 domain-containing protein [Aquimarina intermedia]TYP71437.1 uncharacterized protein DUF2147 [Aquimarina intermedia]
MIYKITLYFLLLFCSSSSVSRDSYLGNWQIEGGSIIHIYQNGDVFSGKILKRAVNPISNLNGLDNKNPDIGLRNRQLIGIDILENLRYDEGVLSGGTIYNADSGHSYAVKLWIYPEDMNICYIRAYKGFLFKTFEAIRVDTEHVFAKKK